MERWDYVFASFGYVLCARVDDNAIMRVYLIGIGCILESNFYWDLHGYWEAFEDFVDVECALNKKLEEAASEIAGKEISVWKIKSRSERVQVQPWFA